MIPVKYEDFKYKQISQEANKIKLGLDHSN